MATQVEVVYPSISSYSGTSQLNLGPYALPIVSTMLRVEARGAVNLQGATLAVTSVIANFGLWAVQWVTHGGTPADVVTTADGPNWFMRQQLGSNDENVTWAPSTDDSAVLLSYAWHADWAGQLPLNQAIDLWWSMREPTGVPLPNFNVFGSIRFWWALYPLS